jgi:hypothetical protein
MSNPVPLRAFVGGVGIALASHNLLLLNGSVFGISGFIHRCYHGALEPVFSVGGLIFGGVAIGALRSTVPPSILPNVISLPIIVTSGFLVGIGNKGRSGIKHDVTSLTTADTIMSLQLSNGCTSGRALLVDGFTMWYSRYSFSDTWCAACRVSPPGTVRWIWQTVSHFRI